MHRKPANRNQNFIRKVRAVLMLQGSDLGTWAREHGYKNATQVSLALHGHRKHPKAQKIVRQLRELVKGSGR